MTESAAGRFDRFDAAFTLAIDNVDVADGNFPNLT